MHDLIAAVVILLVAFFVIKLLFPTKLPDYKVCAGNSCWSTKSLEARPSIPQENKLSTPVENKVTMVKKPPIKQPVNEGMRDNVYDDEGAMLEVLTNPKDMQDARAMLKDIEDDPDLTLNNMVKYSK